MNEEALRQFYSNKIELEAVKEYLLQTLNKVALEKLFKGEDAKPVAEARFVVETAFSNLKEMYEPKRKASNNSKSR